MAAVGGRKAEHHRPDAMMIDWARQPRIEHASSATLGQEKALYRDLSLRSRHRRRNRRDLNQRLCRAVQGPERRRRSGERKACAGRKAGTAGIGRTAKNSRPRGAGQAVCPGRKNHNG